MENENNFTTKMDNPTMINDDGDDPLSSPKQIDSKPNNDSKDSIHSNSSWVKFDDSSSPTVDVSKTELERRAIGLDEANNSLNNNNNNKQYSKDSATTSSQQQQQFATIDLSSSTSVEINSSNLNKNNEDIIIHNKSLNNNNSAGSSSSNVVAPTTKSGFANGDIIVTLYPLNDSCAWITPATFKAHLVPEELMAQPLTLTVEDYVSTMSILLNDYRFHLYITLHKRILAFWITLSIIVLLGILASGTKGLSIFLAGILWLVLNALGIFLVIFIKNRLYRMLENCIAQVNTIFGRHNIFLGVDDRGHFSCHKINLIFVYFDSKYCLKFLQDMLKNNNNNGQINDPTAKTSRNNQQQQQVDHFASIIDGDHEQDDENIYITGSSGVKQISQKEKQAEKLLYRYSQRWIREFGRQRMSLSVINPQPVSSSSMTAPTTDDNKHTNIAVNNLTQTSTNGPQSTSTIITANDIPPRHCRVAKCFCQYIEELYRFKYNLHSNQPTRQQQQQSFWYSCLLPANWFNCF